MVSSLNLTVGLMMVVSIYMGGGWGLEGGRREVLLASSVEGEGQGRGEGGVDFEDFLRPEIK